MKKTVILTSLILAITASLIAGTLASYNITLDNVASGSVVAKEFVFFEGGYRKFRSGH